jgi:hypothetical protein
LVIILAAEILVSLAVIISDSYEIRLIKSITNYEFDFDTANSLIEINDMWQSVIATIEFFVTITSLVFLPYWFCRAYRNLSALGAGRLESSPRWVVAYFFVPILCLWKPVRALEEIWKWSYPSYSEGSKSSFILIFWWIPFVISNMLGFLLIRGYFSAETFQDWINLDTRDIVLEVLVIIANTIFIYIAKEVCRRQEMKSHNVPTVS